MKAHFSMNRKDIKDWLYLVVGIILLVLFLMSCSTTTKLVQVPISDQYNQTTKVKEVLKDSIIYVVVEKEKNVNVIPSDTTSILKTKYARSEAKLENGRLKHTLENRNDSIPVKIIYKDKIQVDSVFVKKEVPVEVRVDVPIRDNFFWISIIINIIFIGIRIFKIILKFKR